MNVIVIDFLLFVHEMECIYSTHDFLRLCFTGQTVVIMAEKAISEIYKRTLANIRNLASWWEMDTTKDAYLLLTKSIIICDKGIKEMHELYVKSDLGKAIRHLFIMRLHVHCFIETCFVSGK